MCWLHILLCSFISLNAQSHQQWNYITQSNGLAHNFVTSIMQSQFDGSIYVGTLGGGVSRFYDGVWSTWTTRNGLSHDWVLDVFEAPDSSIWTATYDGISRLYQGQWETFFTEDYDLKIECGHSTRYGLMIFGSQGGGALAYYQGDWSHLGSKVPGLWIYEVDESQDGSLWVCHNLGITQFKGGDIIQHDAGSGLFEVEVFTIHEDNSGMLWAGTTGGIYCFQNGFWEPVPIETFAIVPYIRDITETLDGALWFASEGEGVFRLKAGQWKQFSILSGMNDNIVYAALAVEDGSLWLGTRSGGINQYRDTYETVLTQSDGLLWSFPFDIHEMQDGSIWATGNLGAVRFDSGKCQQFLCGDVLPGSLTAKVAEDKEGGVWVTTNAGAARYDGADWTAYTDMHGISSDTLISLLCASDGAVYVGGRQGVYRHQNNEWEHWGVNAGLPDPVVRHIMEAEDHSLWFATRQGLAQLKEGQWTYYTSENGLPENDDILCLHEDGGKKLWIGTREGLACLHENTIQIFQEEDGLASNIVGGIQEAPDGSLWIFPGWFAEYSPITIYRHGQWFQYATQSGRVDHLVYDVEFISNGDIWISTNGSDISVFNEDKTPPYTFIHLPTDSILSIESPVFTFSGKDDRTNAAGLTFSWCVVLEGQSPADSDWSLFSFETFATQIVNNGSYQFQVRAMDGWGNIDPTPAVIPFVVDITPPTVTLESPAQDARIAGRVAIVGSAYDNSPLQDFQSYSLDYQYQDEWIPIVSDIRQEVRSDTAAVWDVSHISGSVLLRITAVDSLNHRSEDQITVTVVDAVAWVRHQQGAQLASADGSIQLNIQARALAEDAEIAILREEPDSAEETMQVTLFPSELALQKSGILTLQLDETADNGNAGLYQYDDLNNQWTFLGGTVTGNDQLICPIHQLGVFAVKHREPAENLAYFDEIRCSPRGLSSQSNVMHISFCLRQDANASLRIFNQAGRLVKTLANEVSFYAGVNTLSWDGRDSAGGVCLNGIYIVSLQTNGKIKTKVVLINDL